MNPIRFIPSSRTVRFVLLLSFSSDHAFAAEPER
jgi:hypothetical protein